MGLNAENIPGEHTNLAEQELLIAERHAALREAFTDLPASCQQLIAMLIKDPPVPYAKISAELGIPIGSIGPTRRRCLDKLRRHPLITALINAEPATGELDTPGAKQRCYDNDQQITKARGHIWMICAQSPK